jgi:4-hydroxybenzoyl-CoA reductase subunit beta
MIALPHFTLLRPATLAEAARLAGAPEARVVAGGTGLIPNLRLGLGAPRTLVSLDALEELRRIEVSPHGTRIGACVSLQVLSEEPGIPTALREAARAVAAPGHRSAATLGGNLCLDTRCVYYNQSEQWRRSNGYCLKFGGDTCHVAPQGKKCRAAYSGDLAPALLVLEAEVELLDKDGMRRAGSLERLYQDDGAKHLALQPGEIVAAVHLPPAKGRSGYAKLRARGSIDFPLAGVAMMLSLSNNLIRELRVAITGTNSRPFLVEGTQALAGAEPNEAASAALAKLVQKQVGPMRTTLSAADYRRQGAMVLARRLLARLTKEDSPGEIQGETS